MTKVLCPKCLDREEVAMKRLSVSEAIFEGKVGSLFSTRRMYLPYRCPKCGFELRYPRYSISLRRVLDMYEMHD